MKKLELTFKLWDVGLSNCDISKLDKVEPAIDFDKFRTFGEILFYLLQSQEEFMATFVIISRLNCWVSENLFMFLKMVWYSSA